jgi:hypothetical protein
MAPTPSPRDADDPGPPKLQRGKPERVIREEQVAASLPPPADTGPPASAPPSAAPAVEAADTPEDPVVVKAREFTQAYTESLPNYIVQQFTTRYWTETSKPDWKALDILSAEVVYDKGKESYRNVKINGKLIKKPLEEAPGSISYGEFGTTLVDLFSMATNASFTRRGSSSVSRVPAMRYDFVVEQPSSHWLTRYSSHSIKPAYKGSVWIQKDTGQALRIEMQARNIPEAFPLDAIEWVVEYGSVRIGTSEYIVPVHAENMACLRGTSQCTRNATDFRNYRRFTGEAQIYTTDSTVDFGKQPAEAPAGKP